jgi:hypothetical protein
MTTTAIGTVTVGTVISTPQTLFSLPVGSVLVNKEDDYIYHIVKGIGKPLHAVEYAGFSSEPTYAFLPSDSFTLPNNINLTVIHIAR